MEVISQVIKGFTHKDTGKITFANIVYFLCGGIGILYIMYIVSPFYIEFKKWDVLTRLNLIMLKEELNSNSLIVTLCFWSIVLRLPIDVAKKKIIRAYDEFNNREFTQKVGKVHTIMDIYDLATALLMVIFTVSVAFNYMKSEVLIQSVETICIYSYILYRFIKFIYIRTLNYNRKIIWNAVKEYKDLD